MSATIFAEKTESTESKNKKILALGEAMKKEGKAEHERSNCGNTMALILELEIIESSMHEAATQE